MTDNAMGSYSDPNITPPMVKQPAGITACLGHVRIKRNSVHNCCGSNRTAIWWRRASIFNPNGNAFRGIATLFQTVALGR